MWIQRMFDGKNAAIDGIATSDWLCRLACLAPYPSPHHGPHSSPSSLAFLLLPSGPHPSCELRFHSDCQVTFPHTG